MHAFFARLRAQSSTTPPAVVVSAETDPTSKPVIAPYTHRISRKIHPDPSALLATYSEERQEHEQNKPDRGLRPSSRRPSADRPISGRSGAHITNSKPTLDEVNEPTHSREPSQGAGFDESGQSRWLLHRFSQFSSPSVWSTFGRGKQHSSPRIDNFDVHGSRPGTPNKPSRAPSRKSSAKPRSSQSHESPGSESKRSSTNQSMTTTTARSRPESTRTHVTTTAVAAHDLALEYSPRTFGHPTPEASSSPLIASSSLPPPLPHHFHHALRTIQAEEEQEMEETEAVHHIPLTIKDDTGALYHRSQDQGTYPRRSRIRINSAAFSSLPSVNLRSRSKSSPIPNTLPKVQQIFNNVPSQRTNTTVFPTMATATHDAHEVNSDVSSARTRTLSGTGRRSSAEWSAEQAAAGDVNTWPAQVSRQILELSLGSRATGDPLASFPRSADTETRDSEAKTETSFSSPPLLSSPSPSFSLSPSLGPPFLLQDPHANLSSHTPHHKRKLLGWSSTRKQGKKTTEASHGSLDVAMTGQKKKNASVRSSTPPSRPSTVTRSAEDTFAGPSSSSLHQTPFQSFSATSSPASGSGSGSVSGHSPRRSVSDSARKFSKHRSLFSTPVKVTASESDDSNDNAVAGKGKRKADDVEGTPPDQKRESYHATFALPADPRPSRASANSASSAHAPSSYQRKRAKLSTSTPIASPPDSRSGSSHREGISRGHVRGSSRTTLPEKDRPTSSRSQGLYPRQSLSQVSIPISALVSPHAPSVSISGTFHMRDPRKPRRVTETGWALGFPIASEPGSGSPVHAWLFFVGWVVFPLWWVAAFWRIPKTRRVGEAGDIEKAVMLDDPQVEFDARSWRTRCRVMSAVSLLTYIPFIVLVVVFVRRSH